MRAMSKKRAKLMREIGPMRAQFVRDNPVCQIQSPVCSGRSEHCHEKLSRGRGGSLSDLDNLMSSCDLCNTFVSDNPAWSEERGFLVSSYGR